MPTPLELVLDPVSWMAFAIYLALMAWERLAPARVWPAVRGWFARSFVAYVVFFFVSAYLPLWLAPRLSFLTLLDASELGTTASAALALLVYEGLVYAWHRAMHTSDTLFRSFHQLHHSAERLDVPGAYWFSPLDMVGFTCLSTLSLCLVRITPEATMWFALAVTLLSVFQHANVRTPVWLGYLVQRPESHSYHHGRHIHRGNYSDLPIFDLLFGTFVNPQHFEREIGFYDGASDRVLEMLLCRDVTSPALDADERASIAPA